MRQAYRVQPSLTETWLDLEHARELKVISELLDADRRIYELALEDLMSSTSAASGKAGARGLSAEQVVRALILKQMNGFSYRELAFHLADSRTYRTFCRLGVEQSTPKKSTLAAAMKALRAETLEAIHRRIIGLAQDAGVESGTRVRCDATVVESNIHHPTDSELLWDCVRVLTRLLRQARECLGAGSIVYQNRTRRAKRRRREIHNARLQKKRVKPYRDLIRITEQVRAMAQANRDVLAASCDPKVQRLLASLDRTLELSRQVVNQARRRVLLGETVPSKDKVVSIFEDHTDIVRKDGRETHYGHKICLTAGRSSLVLDCQILRGNPADASLAQRMVERHTDLYGTPPRQIAFDGAFFSKDNLHEIKQQGVEDVAFAKKRGVAISDMARSTWVYQRLRYFRAGIEGIISFLKRGFGLDRCTWKSWQSFQSYVWSSILTSNLLVIARHLL